MHAITQLCIAGVKKIRQAHLKGSHMVAAAGTVAVQVMTTTTTSDTYQTSAPQSGGVCAFMLFTGCRLHIFCLLRM
jgi:hypothetical protein